MFCNGLGEPKNLEGLCQDAYSLAVDTTRSTSCIHWALAVRCGWFTSPLRRLEEGISSLNTFYGQSWLFISLVRISAPLTANNRIHDYIELTISKDLTCSTPI